MLRLPWREEVAVLAYESRDGGRVVERDEPRDRPHCRPLGVAVPCRRLAVPALLRCRVSGVPVREEEPVTMSIVPVADTEPGHRAAKRPTPGKVQWVPFSAVSGGQAPELAIPLALDVSTEAEY
jgi:hypothetical protein